MVFTKVDWSVRLDVYIKTTDVFSTRSRTSPVTAWPSVWASLSSHQQQNCQTIRDAYLLDATTLPVTKVSSLYSCHQSQSSQPPHPPSESPAGCYSADLLAAMTFSFWLLARLCIFSCLLVFEDMSHVGCLSVSFVPYSIDCLLILRNWKSSLYILHTNPCLLYIYRQTIS